MKNKFEKEFRNKLIYTKDKFSDYVFLCVGTDKVIGDSFGPLVGESLNNKIGKKYEIIGSTKENLTYTNIQLKIDEIFEKYNNPCIIAIDSALSHERNIGRIVISRNKMTLGKSLNKDKFNIGDICIKAIVAKKYDTPMENYIELKRASYQLIEKLVKITSNGINNVMSKNI